MKNTNTDLKFFLPQDIDEDDSSVIEESPNSRWSKLNSEITVQKLLDFDAVYLAIDTDRGIEVAWNEIVYNKTSVQNRFEDASTLASIYRKLKHILDYLCRIEHSNILKFYDHWYTENENVAKIVVITEYSSAGTFRKALEVSKSSNTRVKEQSYRRWLNQIVYAFKYLHSEKVSIFQGKLNTETIFIQNNGVIKLAPTLLLIRGVCEITKSSIKISPGSLDSNTSLIMLTNEIIVKDIHAIGRLAIEVFKLNKTTRAFTSPSRIKSNGTLHNACDTLTSMLNEEDFDDSYKAKDELQSDFVNKCFNMDTQHPEINSIWYHPFINTIYSLKILSVYSILNYFQEKVKPKSKNNSSTSLNKMASKIFRTDELNTCLTEMNNNINNNNNLTKAKVLRQSNSNSSFKDRRKISLTFLSNFNLSLPQNFFSILDDIRYGLYPRLFKDIEARDISPPFNSSLDNLLQRKQYVDRNCSILDMNNYLFNSIQDEAGLDKNIKTNIYDKEATNDVKNLEQKQNQQQLPSENLPNSPLHQPHLETKTKYTESRRLRSCSCSINKNDNAKTIELNLNLEFDDNLNRKLECNFPLNFLDYFDCCNSDTNLANDKIIDELNLFNKIDEQSLENKITNICVHLSNELIDYGLINHLDNDIILSLLFENINKNLIC